VQVASIKTRVETAAWFQRLKLKYDKMLSSFAFKFNLRRYSMVACLTLSAVMNFPRRQLFALSLMTVGPGRRCSTHHKMNIYLRNEGLKSVERDFEQFPPCPR
jgi:hypothetical protein